MARDYEVNRCVSIRYAHINANPIGSAFGVAVNGRPAPFALCTDIALFRDICMPPVPDVLVEETELVRGGVAVPCRSCLI